MFQLLLDEKQYADRRIGAYFEIQAKTTALTFTVLVAALGWVFASSAGSTLSGPRLFILLLASAAVGSLGTLQGALYQSFALSFMHYKRNVVGVRIQHHLHLPYNPLGALAAGNEGPAGRPLRFTAIVLVAGTALLSIGLVVAALFQLQRAQMTFFLYGALLLTVALVLAANASGVWLLRAWFQVRRDAGPPANASASDQPPN